MPDCVEPMLPLGMMADVPELVEVVYQPAGVGELIREHNRCRSEIEEAIEALDSVLRDLDRQRVGSVGIMRRQLATYYIQLNHVKEHMLWALDPGSSAPQ